MSYELVLNIVLVSKGHVMKLQWDFNDQNAILTLFLL